MEKEDAALLEFYGILLGDGCISEYISHGRPVYEIRIEGHSETDYIYFQETVVPLIKLVFGRTVKIFRRRTFNGIFVRFYFKEQAKYLNEVFNFPFGKKGEIQIPGWISGDWNFLKHVLRGFFDTDGCIYFTKNNSTIRHYPIIELSTHSSALVTQLYEALSAQGFVVKRSFYGDSIKLHGIQNMLKWFNEIGSSHIDKHSKVLFWKQNGFCPRIDELPLPKRLKALDMNFSNVGP